MCLPITSDLDDYNGILDAFSLNGIDYLVFGTWALKKAFPLKMKDYTINDCDVRIKFDLPQIRHIILLLRNSGWNVSVWGTEIEETITEHFLKNKYYMRAKLGNLTLDLVYECEYVTWEEMYRSRVTVDGYVLASLEHILLTKEQKGTARDHEIIRLFRG